MCECECVCVCGYWGILVLIKVLDQPKLPSLEPCCYPDWKLFQVKLLLNIKDWSICHVKTCNINIWLHWRYVYFKKNKKKTDMKDQRKLLRCLHWKVGVFIYSSNWQTPHIRVQHQRIKAVRPILFKELETLTQSGNSKASSILFGYENWKSWLKKQTTETHDSSQKSCNYLEDHKQIFMTSLEKVT